MLEDFFTSTFLMYLLIYKGYNILYYHVPVNTCLPYIGIFNSFHHIDLVEIDLLLRIIDIVYDDVHKITEKKNKILVKHCIICHNILLLFCTRMVNAE